MTTGTTLVSPHAISTEAADQLFLSARTANTFSSDPVPVETFAAIYDLTKMGPTAMNNQPLRISWIQSPQARERLVAHMAEPNRDKTLTAPAVALLSYDTSWHEHFPTFFPHAPERRTMFDGNDELRGELAKNNAWLQSGYFIMAVRAVGLHAGPVGGFDALEADADFNSGTGHRAFLVVNVGTPGENPWYDRLPRLDSDVATRIL